uniref:Reverse transcriptase domain-containing protein n=1 Tax=Tanacetum cinerariifolium TaxID=118510 RepID=A0A6L2LQ81_TANCI|nr:hypothetical protein [Tanacetum cinerariifolium]
MRTRSSSNLPDESSPNPNSSNLKRHNRRRSKQPFILEESLVDTMANQRTIAELLRAPTERYAEAIVVPPILAEHFELKQSLINMMTSNQFFGLKKDNPHDHIRWFNKITSTIKYKDVPNSAMKLMLFPFSLVGAARRWLEKEPTPTPPPASVKSVEEICVTCGGAHPYYQCLAADGNTFLKPKDNIQGYISAVAVSYNQDNSSYHPLGVANQIQPSGFAQLNVQNNQNRFSQPQGYNRGNNFNQDSSYQARMQQNQVVPLSELEMIKNMNEINIKAMQTQINNVKNELRNEMKTSIQASMSNQTNELKNMMASFFQMNTAFTSGSGPLPSNTIANPKGELKAITTRSGLVLDGPSVPMPPTFINPEEDERARIERDVFVPVGKFTFPADFVIVDYESNPRVPLVLGTPFLQTARALIDVHGEEMILRDGDEILPLNMRHDTSSYSNQHQKESINMINIYDDSCEDYLEDLFATNHLRDIVLIEKLLNLDFAKDLPPPHNINLLSGSTTSSSPDHLLEEFAHKLALITFPPGNDDLSFDIEYDLREIEYFLNHDPIKEMDSILDDSVNEDNLVDPNDNLFDTIPEMFTDEHALDYSSPSLYDDFDDDLFEFKSDTDNAYDDPFDSKGEKIKESKLLIDELDPLRSSDFLPLPEYDSFLFEDFSEVNVLPSTNNEDKVFSPGIHIHEKLFEVNTHVAPDKNVKKIAIFHASLILEDFDPLLSEPPFHKEVSRSETLLSFSFKNEEKVFKPGILTSKGVYNSLLPELSHQGPKVFKVIKNLESPMEIFPCSHGEDICILDVPCLHFYPL